MREQQRLAGRIFRLIETHLGKQTPVAYGNCSRNPQFMPVFLRHVWKRAIQHPAIQPAISEFNPAIASGPDFGDFHLGYYQTVEMTS